MRECQRYYVCKRLHFRNQDQDNVVNHINSTILELEQASLCYIQHRLGGSLGGDFLLTQG